MIAFLCNKCGKPLDMENENNVHLEISFGKNAIETKGKYGSRYNADLCDECYKAIQPLIDKYYYGGNKYLKREQE